MLAPNKELIQGMLASLYRSHQSVTGAAIALQQTILFPPDPAPEWFEPLDTTLNAARTSALSWLTEVGPPVIAELPQELIAYALRVGVVASNMPDASSADEAARHIRWLKRFATEMPAQSEARQQSLVRFTTDFSSRKAAVETAIDGAKKTLKTEQDKAAELASRIADLHAKISGQTTEANNAMRQTAFSGASMSVALLSWGYAIAAGSGPALPVLAVTGAVIAITYGAITNAIDERHIIEELDEIRDLQVQLEVETQRIAALQGIISALTTLDIALDELQTSVDFKGAWDDINAELDGLLSDMSQPGIDYRELDAIRTLPDAANAWNVMARTATNVQKSASGLAPAWTVNLNVIRGGRA